MKKWVDASLPCGWTIARLADLLTLGPKNGYSPKAVEHPTKVRSLALTATTSGRFDPSFFKYIDEEIPADSPLWLRDGDLLIQRANTLEYVGVAAIYRGPERTFIYPDLMMRARVNDAADVRFVLRALSTEAARRYFRSNATGTAGSMPKVNQAVVSEVPIPLAPIAEQKRIADKLDALLARVDACRQRLDRVPAILKRFRQSVLAAATSGKLTREWREERGLKRGDWRSTTFEGVCAEITVGFVGKMADQYRPSGVPFLRSQNVRPFRFDPRELRYVSPGFHRAIPKSALRPGDVVVVRTGAPGQCCVIPQDLPESNCSDLVIVRPSPGLDSEYAVVFINSETSQSFVRSEQVGVAQSHFNVGSMKRAPIQLPSLEEQREIARRVQDLFGAARELEERSTAIRNIVDRLAPAALAKAFRGELVSQDPNDEPASALLDRLGVRGRDAAAEEERRGNRRASSRSSAPDGSTRVVTKGRRVS